MGRGPFLALAVAQAAGIPLFALVGSSITTEQADDPVITPAGYAFSIWFVIVALCLALALYQLPEDRGERGALPALRTPLAGVLIGFNAWLAVASFELDWVTVVVFATMLALLVWALGLLRHPLAGEGHGRGGRLLIGATVGIYAGWSAIGVFANVATALVDEGLAHDGPDGRGWQLVVLLSAMAAASLIAWWSRGSVWFAGAAVWGLVAVAIGAAGEDGLLSATAVLAAVVVATSSAVAGVVGNRASPQRASTRPAHGDERNVERAGRSRSPMSG